jgi:hypothetical protein
LIGDHGARYRRTGESDIDHSTWDGSCQFEAAKAGHRDLRDALVAAEP